MLRVSDIKAVLCIDLDKLDLAATRSRRAGILHNLTREINYSCRKFKPMIFQLQVFIRLNVDEPSDDVRWAIGP